MASENIINLRILLDTLENYPNDSPRYMEILNDIQSLLHAEMKIIATLEKPGTKIKHYENMCNRLLALLSSQ